MQKVAVPAASAPLPSHSRHQSPLLVVLLLLKAHMYEQMCVASARLAIVAMLPQNSSCVAAQHSTGTAVAGCHNLLNQ